MEQNRKRQLISQTSDACSNMILKVRELRLSVLDLFTTLADNGPDPRRNQQLHKESLVIKGNKLYHQQTLSNLATSHSLCTSSTPPLRIQKQQEQQQQVDLIQYVNQMISNITGIVRCLDQDILILMSNNALINPGESVHLAMDCSVDKHNLYMELCRSYKTYTKLHEYSATVHALLHQQSLKRVHKRSETSLGGSGGGGSGGASGGQSSGGGPRGDSLVASFNPYIYRGWLQKSTMKSVLDTCLKPCEFTEGRYSQPFGVSTGVLQLSVNRILKAILVMRGMLIDAVIVKAYHESFSSKATSAKISSASLLANEVGGGQVGGGSQFVESDDDIDIWSESKYGVFRKLTHHANAAVLHFQYPTFPEIAVRSFLSWFNSYHDLFSATCSRCNSRLRKFMPPICRDFSAGFQPHHDSCK